MEPPRDRIELKTALGMINYLAKFSPNSSEITHPMRKLMNGTSEFTWDDPKASTFQKVKEINFFKILGETPRKRMKSELNTA